jgi:hypothetical protein
MHVWECYSPRLPGLNNLIDAFYLVIRGNVFVNEVGRGTDSDPTLIFLVKGEHWRLRNVDQLLICQKTMSPVEKYFRQPP